jgi:hypothetical protein
MSETYEQMEKRMERLDRERRRRVKLGTTGTPDDLDPDWRYTNGRGWWKANEGSEDGEAR